MLAERLLRFIVLQDLSGIAAGPPLMSLLMKNFLAVSYIVAGGIGILLLGSIVLFIRPERT